MQRMALLLACCACLRAQTAAVEGTVVNQVTGQPMAGVHVRFRSSGPFDDQQAYGAMSDRVGHYSITGFPAGNYLIDAQRRGFFYMRPKNDPTPRISFKPGQHVTDFKIEMAEAAILSGRVLDDNGDPVVTNVSVEAQSGRDSPHNGFGASDERGEFHISVAPGKYYIGAEPPRTWLIRIGGPVGVEYAKTYFPGVAIRAGATAVEAAAGAEIAGMDIHMTRRERGASISGVVTGGDAGGQTLVTATSGEDLRHIRGSQVQPIGPDGHFVLSGLPPGEYRLLGVHVDGKNRLYSQPVDVHLLRDDVTNVTLPLGPSRELTGKLEMEGGPGVDKLTVALQPIAMDLDRDAAPSGAVDAGGAFRISNLAPGHYRVRVTPLPEDAYLKSVRLNGAEAAKDLDLSGGTERFTLKIVVGRNGGQVSGRLVDKDGEPLGTAMGTVLLVADPKDIDFDHSYQMPDEANYGFQGVRPGKYRLLAIDRYWFSGVGRTVEREEALERVVAGAEEIEIHEGDHEVRDLKVIVKEGTDGNGHD